MQNVNRIEKVLEFVEQNRRAGINEISSAFGVSISTARRDLDELARMGKLQRTHGGALFMEKAPPEQPIFQRQAEQSDEKARIGAAAADLICDGETIFLGSGTSVLQICKHLDRFQNLTVYTNSLVAIDQLAQLSQIHLIGIGGQFRRSEHVFYGYLVEQALSDLFVDKVFFGVRAISIDKGLTNDYLPELPTDRAILNKGKEVIVLADHTKFNRVASTLVAPLTAAHKIITDHQTPEETVFQLQEKGIEVIVV